MKNNSSRRQFIRNSLFATTGLSLVSSLKISASVLAADGDLTGYNPYVEACSDLRRNKWIGDHITIRGKVLDRNSKIGLKNVQIEVWHLSPGINKYRHAGKITSDDSGQYEFITDFPGSSDGQVPKIKFKVSSGSKTYMTKLFLLQTGPHICGAHWQDNSSLGDDLMPKEDIVSGNKIVTFNLTI